jgi:hypothetical protein
MRVLLIPCLTLILGSCCTTATEPDLPCPSRPVLEPISVAEQIEMNPETVLKVAQNQLRLKEYAKRLEIRAGCSVDGLTAP